MELYEILLQYPWEAARSHGAPERGKAWGFTLPRWPRPLLDGVADATGAEDSSAPTRVEERSGSQARDLVVAKSSLYGSGVKAPVETCAAPRLLGAANAYGGICVASNF
jgi:hypothetical protein